jgi:HSP20 family protein
MVTRYSGGSLVNEFVSLRDAMDRLFTESFVPGQMRTLWSAGESRTGFPLDVFATENEMTVLAAVPGIDPAQIEISIEKGQVTLKGEIPDVASSEEAGNATWYLHELPRGTFARTLSVPFEIDANAAEATFENGMLRLTLPKAEAARPKQIRVRVAEGGSRPEAIESGSDEHSERS